MCKQSLRERKCRMDYDGNKCKYGYHLKNTICVKECASVEKTKEKEPLSVKSDNENEPTDNSNKVDIDSNKLKDFFGEIIREQLATILGLKKEPITQPVEATAILKLLQNIQKQ